MDSKREEINRLVMKLTGREYVQEPEIRYLNNATNNEVYKYCLDLHSSFDQEEKRYLSIDLEQKLYERSDEDINYGLALVGSDRIIQKIFDQWEFDSHVRRKLKEAVFRNHHWFTHSREKPIEESWVNTLVRDSIRSRDVGLLEVFFINPHLDEYFIESLLHRVGPFHGVDDETFLKLAECALWQNPTYTGHILKDDPRRENSVYPGLSGFKVWEVLLNARTDTSLAIWLTRYLLKRCDSVDLPDAYRNSVKLRIDETGKFFENLSEFGVAQTLKTKEFIDYLIAKFEIGHGDERKVYGELRKAIVATISSDRLKQIEKHLLSKNDSYVTQGYFQGLYRGSCAITKRQFKRNLRKYKEDFILGFLATKPLFEKWEGSRIVRSWVYQASEKLRLWKAYTDRCDELKADRESDTFDTSHFGPQITGSDKWRYFSQNHPWVAFGLWVAAVLLARQIVIWLHNGLH